MTRFKNILYVAQGSVSQGSAMALAMSLAENNQAELTGIDVVPVGTAAIGRPPGGPISTELQSARVSRRRTELEALVGPYRHRRDIQIEVRVGQVLLEVLSTVLRNEHDLLITPAAYPDFIERLFGSNDLHLLRKWHCPVLLPRPDEKANYGCILAAID